MRVSVGAGFPALRAFSDHFLLLVTFLVTISAAQVRFGAFTPAASGQAAVAQVLMLRAFLQLQKQKRPAADPGPGRKFTNLVLTTNRSARSGQRNLLVQ